MLARWSAAGERLRNISLIGALAGAVLVVLFALYAPIPRQLSGEEDLTAAQMPSIRAGVEQVRSPFLKAQEAYLGYVGSHNVSSDITAMEQAIAAVRGNPSDSHALTGLRDTAAPIQAYMGVLLDYAR